MEVRVKNILSVLSLIYFLHVAGCGLANSQYLEKNYSYNTEMESYMGEVMISEIRGAKNDVYNTILPGSIKWELVYAGNNKNNVKIYYREYVVQDGSWYAKDAFTQELNYDLNESDLIRYKNVQLQILTANNEKIVYQVVSDKTQPSTGSIKPKN